MAVYSPFVGEESQGPGLRIQWKGKSSHQGDSDIREDAEEIEMHQESKNDQEERPGK